MSTERMTAIVGARISQFRRQMAEVNKTMRKTATNVVVNVVVNRYKLAQKRLDSIADKIRTLNTVGSNMAFGSLMAISPSIVPILAATVGAIASLGPMIGVLAGSTFALATAFGFAGLAAVAFAGVAIPTISQLFKENAKLNKEQKAARAEFDKMKKTWQGIVKDLEKPVLQAFGESMKVTNKILQMSKPLFQSAADAMNNLLKAMNSSLNSTPVKAFFEYMNKQAGPMFEKIGKSIGNFMQGFMSMMVAFGPLAESTAQGFLQMSQNFATWAAGLSKSEKFQAFVRYVQENMPKVRAIFRDFTAGLIYMFSAFGPLAADMMTGLQNLMARFKEWGATLSQNQQFQSFISYIRTNAPQVLTLIGNLSSTIVNLGIALAPLGSYILGIVNGFLGWLNKMMEIHPWLGQVIGGIIVMTGVLQATIPIITVIVTMFSKFGAALLRNVAMYLYWTAQWVASTAIVYAKSVWVTAKFVANCVLMAAKYAWFAAKVVAQALWWTAATTASLIAWGAKQLATLMATTAKMVARMAWTAAQFVAKYAWMAAQALFHAARMAAAWFIALGPVGWVIATVIALVALIIANWDKVKSWTQQIWTAVWNWIKDIWSKIKTGVSEGAQKIYETVSTKFKEILSFLKGLGSSFLDAGKGLIEQMAKGIKNAAGKVLKEVKAIAQKARDFLPFSPAKTGPLSDIGNLNFGGPIGKSIKKARSVVSRSMTDLVAVARNMVEPTTPQLAFVGAMSGEQFTGMRSDIKPSTPIFKKDKSSTATSTAQNQPLRLEIPVMVDGYEMARASVDYIDGMLGESTENKKVYNGVK
jgi:hypothetical protein